MDLKDIPTFAINRQAGTVLLRIKMESRDLSCREHNRTHHRTSVCEQCTRTRFNSFSDCDSDLVDRCRPYRASAARSRYVNVCAAVCLLLLVGGLSPQSTAAPHWSRNMDRQKRASGPQENGLWANPCDYSQDTSTNSNSAVKYNEEFAKDVMRQANNALKSMRMYKDLFSTKVHSAKVFENLLQDWTGYEWLRNFSSAKERPEVFPQEKTVNQDMPDEFVNNLMTNIDEVLPAMYKTLKVVVAGLNIISSAEFKDDIADENLRQEINHSMHSARAVLCMFYDLMKSRNLPIEVLHDAEINEFTETKTSSQRIVTSLLVYRDAINYLEYLVQVFKVLSTVGPKA